jgi:Holliday junction DNA helicase RuvA
MISALTGRLTGVQEDRAEISAAAGAMRFSILIPASDSALLRNLIGQDVTFHTILDLEGDPSRGGLSPRLIGFLRPEDKRFFELFITVKGIGPKKALRALTVPTAQIAHSIEARDARALSQLDGIGKRMAELIVAELSGKMMDFAHAASPMPGARPQVEEEAILVCVTLGLPRQDAERLLDRARAGNANLKTADGLSREMLRLRSEGI